MYGSAGVFLMGRIASVGILFAAVGMTAVDRLLQVHFFSEAILVTLQHP